LSATWDKDLPRYSTDPAAYMGLLEEQRKAGRAWELQVLSESALDRYGCKVWAPSGKAFCAIGLSPGEAICRAVLAALEGGAE
jgi:hypothetical protein